MKTILFISLMASAFSSFAQADSTPAKPTLTLGVSYSPNANYYGQKAATKLPYVAAVANYKLPVGFYFSGTAYKLLNDSSGTVSAGSLGIGFNAKLSKKWSLDLSYSHNFYAAHAQFLQASNPDNATALLSFESWLTSSLSVDYAFGKTQDVFTTVSIGKAATLASDDKFILSLTPTISVVGGTQHFYQTYITEKRIQDSLLGRVLTPIFGGGGNTTTTSKTTSATEFNLLSYNLRLPLAYSRAHYQVEGAYQLSVLSDKAQSGAGTTNSFASLTFYYQF